MAELELTIDSKPRSIGKVERDEAAARPASKAVVKKGISFEWFLVVTVFLVGLVGAYESLAQVYYPAFSLLRAAHLFGYLKAYDIIYEPSKGIWHPVGWTGSAMMVVMMLYTLRKRLGFMSIFGSMRRWLSLHMFLGIMGPLLVTLHTTFKLHGLIATSFWCMIVTMVFGILGRYIYIQIPRSITGTELGEQDIESMVASIEARLANYRSNANLSRFLGTVDCPASQASSMSLPVALAFMFWTDMKNRLRILRVGRILKTRFNLAYRVRRDITAQLRKKAALIRKRSFLTTSHRMLHYWHVFHIPLAIVMFLIMFLHIIVYYIFSAAV